MKEKEFATIIGKYIREKIKPVSTCCYEYKIVNSGPFRFDSVADHQIKSLLLASTGGLYRKEPDMAAVNGFSGQKPFDAYYMVNALSFIVLMFYKPRKEKVVYFIEINEFVKLKENWPRKSIREEELKKYFTGTSI